MTTRLDVFRLVVSIGLLLLVSVPLFRGCVHEERTVETLTASGFSDIEVDGYAWLACSASDAYQTKFRARNPSGDLVEGVVCCGMWKSCTVRF